MSQIVIQKEAAMNMPIGANVCNCSCTIAKHDMTPIGKLACRLHKNCGNFGRGKPLTAEEIAYCGLDMKEYQ